MKKVLVIVFAVVGILAVYVYIVCYAINRKYDVSIMSVDKKTILQFDNIAQQDRLGQTSYQRYNFVLAENVFLWEDVIKDHPGYLYSLDDDNKQCSEETGRYILCQDGHYFYMRLQDGNKVFVTEMVFEVCYSESDFFMDFFLLPLVDIKAVSEGDNHFEWKNTAGLTSFEDLVEFYNRTDPKLFTIDSEKKSITLYSRDTRVKTPLAEISVSSDGISVIVPDKLIIERNGEL